MTQSEFLSWWAFHDLYPFDDFNRYHRPAALVANSFSGRDITASLAWLQAEPKAPPRPGEKQYGEIEKSLLRAFGNVVVKKAAPRKRAPKAKG